MYSELNRIMNNDTTFDKSVFKNPSVTRQTVAGIYVYVRMSSDGSICDVSCKKNETPFIGIRKDNSNIFPKYNLGYDLIQVDNVPEIINGKGKDDFSNIKISIIDDKKQLEKPLRYSKELLARFTKMEKLDTMTGKLLCSMDKIIDVGVLLNEVFQKIKQDSVTNELSNTFIGDIVKIKSSSKKVSLKIPVIFSYEEEGVSSLDSDDITLGVISRTVEMPPSKMVKYGNGKEVEIYKNLPKYKFPCGIADMYIFARNSEAPSMSVYGKYGSDTFILPTDKCNSILSYLDHILPVDGKGKSFIPVKLSRFEKGILSVVFDESQCKENILEFFDILDKEEKKGMVSTYKSEFLESIKSMKDNKNEHSDKPVEVLLIGAVDKASVGLVSSMNITKQKILDRIHDWCDHDLPYPQTLITSMKAKAKLDRSDIKYVFSENTGLFGYDNLLQFTFGEDNSLDKTILKKLIDNLKAYVVSYKKIKTNKIGEDQIKFLKYVSERTQKTNMTENYKTLGKILSLGDAIQTQYWNKKNIKGENQRTIGSQCMELVMSGRTKDAFMQFSKGVMVYINWADSVIRISKNNNEKVDSTLEYILNSLRYQMHNAKKIELEKFFSQKPSDIDMSTVMIEYIAK